MVKNELEIWFSYFKLNFTFNRWQIEQNSKYSTHMFELDLRLNYGGDVVLGDAFSNIHVSKIFAFLFSEEVQHFFHILCVLNCHSFVVLCS